MEKEDIGKGLGFLGILSLLFLKNCDSCDNIAKNSDSLFSCNKASDDIVNETTTTVGHNSTRTDIPNNWEKEIETGIPSGSGSKVETNATDGTSPFEVRVILEEVASTDEKQVSQRDIPEGSYYLKKKSDGTFVSTIERNEAFYSLDDVQLRPDEPLIFDGELSKEDIRALNKKGVKFIVNKAVYDRQKNIRNYKLVVVFSEDIDRLKELYEINDRQAEDILNSATDLMNNNDIVKVADKHSLEESIASLKDEGYEPVVVFHNNENALFGETLSYYSVTNVITCKSHNISQNTFAVSTDNLNIHHILESAVVNNNQENLFDFYRGLSFSYVHKVDRTNRKHTIVVVYLPLNNWTDF